MLTKKKEQKIFLKRRQTPGFHANHTSLPTFDIKKPLPPYFVSVAMIFGQDGISPTAVGDFNGVPAD